MNYKDMEEVDDGVYVYGGDEEAILNTAMNVSVPCDANDDAMSDLTKSSLTSRAGWTDEEHAVGHVLVVGDGGPTSQSAMEVEGKSGGDKGSHMVVDSSVNNSVPNRKGKDRVKKRPKYKQQRSWSNQKK